jgi:tRNA A-37 threonylcarbamoyl transferase component Bud32
MAGDKLRPIGVSNIGPGMVLDGKYEILSLLGAGGMGEVFKARHVHLDAFRCVKVMKESLLANDVYRGRFLREARLATQVHHPNIAVVHDFFLGEGGSYMVTEYIDGTTVRQWSAAYGRFPLALAIDVASQVLAGLDHIHRRGLLHRDISPDNVMLSYDGDDCFTVKIIDLGVAKDINTLAPDMTQAGMLIGNPKYMSPEQLGFLPDDEQLDGRADLYSLGVVLYEMLLGVPPFASETPQGYMMKHLTQAPARFAHVQPEMEWPEGIEPVIFRALAKNRKERYHDAREMLAAVKPFLSTSPGSLTRTAVARLRRGPEATMVLQGEVMPTAVVETRAGQDWEEAEAAGTIDGYREYLAKHPDTADSSEAKARLFELELLETVRERAEAGDRDALQRLGEAHPKGSKVGDAAREALATLTKTRRRERDDDEAFQRAWEAGTSATWRRFIEEHHDSPLIERAHQFVEESLAFEAAVEKESETGLRQFLRVWPDGRHHLEAEIHIVELKRKLAGGAFHDAVAAGTFAAMREFIARFPSSLHSEEANRVASERLAFETAQAADSEEGWDLYLAKWEQAPYTAEARAAREQAREREEAAYKAAGEGGTSVAWAEYLAAHPHGKRNARAERNRREAAAFEKAQRGDRAAMEEFLRQHPEGLLTREAQRQVWLLADEEDFAEAQEMNTPESWHLYLTAHPTGAHAATARQQLVVLEDAAFAEVLSKKDPRLAAEFLGDFPQSPRREELSHLAAQWSDLATVQSALDALAVGDCHRAESLLGQIHDPERRQEVAAELVLVRRKTEPADWNTAWESGTAEAWGHYLAAHAHSPRLEQARDCRQEAHDFELAVSTNTTKMWRAFIKSWPDGRHRLDAEIRLRASGG